jgi:hypothetical protein
MQVPFHQQKLEYIIFKSEYEERHNNLNNVYFENL